MALYSATQTADIPTLTVGGHMDLADSDTFLSKLAALTSDTDDEAVIVDISQLKRIGSAGMRALTLTHQRLAKRKARLVVAGPTGDVLETIRIARIDTILVIAETMAHAVEICRTDADGQSISDHRRRRWALPAR
ncbi:MAG: STAS domain-containing protein [Pseudomonadota bacterium]